MKKRILVIDDNEEMLNYLTTLFQLEDYEVIEAENGEQGLALAIHHIPDFIVSDIMMPNIDGFILIEKLNENTITSGIPLIFISALPAKEPIIRLSKELGAKKYIQKPFEKNALLSAIKEYISA